MHTTQMTLEQQGYAADAGLTAAYANALRFTHLVGLPDHKED